jgi:hypothetical protein
VQWGGRRAAARKALPMLLRRLFALALVLTIFAALPPVAGAQGSDSYAQASQPPEPPGGEPQPGTPTEPTDPTAPGTPGGESPAGGGGLLPRTGLGAGWIALIGIALLFVGIRLQLIARIREVVRRYVTPKTKLRESLEELRAAGVEEERRRAELGPQVEPSTPTARRMADVH